MTLIYSLNVKSIKERLTCSFIIIFSPFTHGGVQFLHVLSRDVRENTVIISTSKLGKVQIRRNVFTIKSSYSFRFYFY